MASDTEQKILDIAEDLLQTRGFNGFSYQDIANAVGIRKASIHYYFPSKEDLGVAIVKRYRKDFGEWVEMQRSSTRNALEKLDEYLKFYIDIADVGKKICLSGVLSAEFFAVPESVQKELQGMVQDVYQWLLDLIQEGREQGYFREEGTVEEQAMWFGSALQGALQIARVTGNTQVFVSVANNLRDIILK